MALVNCGFWLLLILSVRACCRERERKKGGGSGRRGGQGRGGSDECGSMWEVMRI